MTMHRSSLHGLDPQTMRLVASLRRTRWALIWMAVLAVALAAGVGGWYREEGFNAGVRAAETHIEDTVGEAYHQGRRDALEATYVCRGVAI
jgi:hypothetical protein